MIKDRLKASEMLQLNAHLSGNHNRGTIARRVGKGEVIHAARIDNGEGDISVRPRKGLYQTQWMSLTVRGLDNYLNAVSQGTKATATGSRMEDATHLNLLTLVVESEGVSIISSSNNGSFILASEDDFKVQVTGNVQIKLGDKHD